MLRVAGQQMKTILKQSVLKSVWPQLRMLKHASIGSLRNLCERCGFIVSRTSDYYSPIPSERALRKQYSRWAKPSALRGVTYDLEALKSRVQHFRKLYYDDFAALPSYRDLQEIGFGPGYTNVDAFTLYSYIRDLKPARYLEVGSGLSTYYCHLARQRNRKDGCDTTITCIEPYPFAKLREIENMELIQAEVQDVPLATFQTLKAGDVLFIDSSHIVRLDGDVPYLFLEILPAIAPGVHIHIHDIAFPYNIPYPANYWTLVDHPTAPHWPMYWTEAMLLQAFLAFNPSFEVTFSCPMIRHFDEDFLRKTLPIYKPVKEEQNTFSSIWLRRIH